MKMRSLLAFSAAALFGCAGVSPALEIVPTFVDGAGQTWDAARRGVIEQAIADWDSRILNVQTIPVTFDFTHAGAGAYLGLWQGKFTAPLGVGADVYPWTPGVQQVVHFNADQMNSAMSHYLAFTTGPVPSADWDALSIARHELGHMLGFIDNFYYDNYGEAGQSDKWVSHIVGATFDPGGLNVRMAAADNLAHTANSGSTANDLMNVSLVNGVRRPISALDQAMLEEAYHYQLAPDPNADGTVNFSDLLLLAQHYGQANANFPLGDFNADGSVGFDDLLVLAQHYGQTLSDSTLGAAAPALASVPEPSALAFFAALALCLPRRATKRDKARQS